MRYGAGLWAIAFAVVAAFSRPAVAANGEVLRVCADANHLPYSNAAGEGFENQLAERVAAAMGRSVETTWWPQRRGFLRNTLDAGLCDVVVGVPVSLDRVLTTEPYYRSCYAWVFRAGEAEPTLDAADLADRRIGVHLIGDDYANSPPAHALAEYGAVEHVVGYSVYGDYGEPSPLRGPVDAVARGEIDAAILWGPIAGFFGKTHALRVVPIPEVAGYVFAYPIAMGVRRGDALLREELDQALATLAPEIAVLLEGFGVPRCDAPTSAVLRRVAAEPEARGGAQRDPMRNPVTGDAGAIEAGAKLFKKLNCSACHGAAGGGGMGPSLTDEAWKTGDGSDADLLTQVLEGRATMPPYKGVIGEAEAWQLIAFIRTLYKGDPAKKTW